MSDPSEANCPGAGGDFSDAQWPNCYSNPVAVHLGNGRNTVSKRLELYFPPSALLQSFVLFCVFLHPTAFRTPGFGNFRNLLSTLPESFGPFWPERNPEKSKKGFGGLSAPGLKEVGKDVEHFRKRAEYCFESTVSEERTH